MKQINVSLLRQRFYGQDYVTKHDLQGYFAEQEPNVNENTVRWRIHNLKETDVIHPVKRGVYAFSPAASKPVFKPATSRKIQQLYDAYLSNLQRESCSLWSTEWLAEFMELQPMRHLIVFEIGKEMMEMLFVHTRLKNFDVFLNPNRQIMADYVLTTENPVIIRPLPSRAPITTNDRGLPIPTLEKILVDLFCDKDIFIAYQGSELKNIFNNAWKNYQLNPGMLLSYAKRRRRAKQLLEFLKNSAPTLYRAISK